MKKRERSVNYMAKRHTDLGMQFTDRLLYNWTEIIENLRQERRRIARLRNPKEQWERALRIYSLVLKSMGRKPKDLVSQVINIAEGLSHHAAN